MTSSLGLKITNGLSTISSMVESAVLGEADVFGGNRVDRRSKSRASVLGYFDRSSVGANWNQPHTLTSSLARVRNILA